MSEQNNRIVHVVGSLIGGGAEKQMKIFIASSKNDYDHHIICLNKNSSDSVFPAKIHAFRKKYRYDLLFKEFNNCLKHLNPKIVHIWLPAMLPYAILPCLKNRLPVVCGIRSSYKPFRPLRIFQQIMYLLTNKVVSNVHPEDLSCSYRFIYRLKVGHYIPNAILTHNPDNAKKIQAFYKNQLKIIFAGRLIEDKNVSILLELASKLKNNNIDFKMDIFGEGDLYSSLVKRVLDLDLDKSINFMGFVDNLSERMKAYNLFILPSLREGMPNVVFEAINNNLIPVLSNIPVHKRWFSNDENAYFFNPKSVDSLFKTIMTILNTDISKLNKVHEKGIELCSQLDIESYKNKYSALYNEMIK